MAAFNVYYLDESQRDFNAVSFLKYSPLTMYNIHSRPKDDQSDDEYIGILNSPKVKTTATKNDSDLIMQHQVWSISK